MRKKGRGGGVTHRDKLGKNENFKICNNLKKRETER